MKLKHFTIALAAGLLLGGLGLPRIASAGPHGGGGGGFGGGRGGVGGHMGGMPRNMGAMGMRGMGPMGTRGMGAMSFRSGSAMRGYGIPYGARSHGQNFHALNSNPGNMRFNKGYSAGRYTGGTALAGSGISHNALGAAGNLNARPLAANNFKQLAANPQLRQAALTRQNAFFNNRFGYNNYRWNNNYWHSWYGRWYGYRWWGPVFWPYWFGDYFSYAFWPYDYYDTFWGYGPDVILWGAFWPYGEFAYDNYANHSAYAGEIYRPYRRRVAASPAAPDPAAAVDTCAGFAPGVSDLPVAQLDKIVDATEEQRTALNDLKAATSKAADILKQSCSSETPLTPVARLDAMQRRLTAMAEANEVVREPLVRLYGLFSDDQKQRLDGLARPNSRRAETTRAKDMNVAELCTSQAGFTNVPAEQITKSIQLTDAQNQELEKLKAASAQASDGLKASCPAAVPETLDGRLDAARQRVTALITAVDTVRPAVHDFYASLTDEQKAALSIQPSQQQAENNRG